MRENECQTLTRYPAVLGVTVFLLIESKVLMFMKESLFYIFVTKIRNLDCYGTVYTILQFCVNKSE